MKVKQSNHNSGKRPTIGMFMGDVNAYTDLIWSGFAAKAKEYDINTLAFVGRGLSYDDEDRTTSNIIYQFANQHNIDGLIILSAAVGHLISYQELSDFCCQFSPLPIVSVGEAVDGVVNLLVDNQQGVRHLIEHLIDEHGRRRIAFILGPADNAEAQERLQAYRQTLADRDISLTPELIVEGGFSYQHGQAAVLKLMQRKIKFDALVSFNDACAWGAMDALQAQGIYIPGDIAVTGFDDIAGSQHTLPPLTTVRQPLKKLGIKAFELVWAMMQEVEVPQDVTIGTEMMARQSCGCLPLALRQVQMQPPVRLDQDNRSPLLSQKEATLKDWRQALGYLQPIIQAWEDEWVPELLAACYDEIFSEKPGAFLPKLNFFFQQTVVQNQNLDLWHEVLSVLRFQVAPYLQTGSQMQQVETLWQQARILLSNVLQQAQVRVRLQANLQTRLLFQINEEVVTTFDLPKLMAALSDALEQLSISFCFLCLNDTGRITGQDELPLWARLVMAYRQGEQRQLEPGGLRFPTAHLLPDGYWPSPERCDALLLSLRFQDHYLGHAIFEMGDRDGFVYDALQIQISSAVRGAYLIEQLSQAQADLEDRVEERTAALQKEIAERIRVETTLSENERRYRALFEQTNDAVFILDIEGRHLMANQRAADLLGYTIEELVGKHVSEIVVPDEYSNSQNRMQRIMDGEQLPIYERKFQHKDGQAVPVEINVALVSDAQGKPLHIQSIVRDISERKRTERILQALNLATLAMRQALTPEEIFTAMGSELKSQGLESVVFRTNYDLSTITPKYYSYAEKVISTAQKLLGVELDAVAISVEAVDIFQTTVWEQETVFVRDPTEIVSQFLPQIVQSSAKKIVKLLGLPCLINAPLVVDDQIMGMLSVQSSDLTVDDIPAVTAFAHQMASTWQKARLMQDLELSLVEQIRTEEFLRESEEKYRTLFELSPEAIILVGLNGIILDANQGAANIGGGQKNEIVGQSFLELGLWDDEKQKKYLDLFSQAISGEFIGPLELQLNLRKGEALWVEIHPALLEKSGEALALQLLIRDITDRREAEQAIQQRVSELETIYQTSLKLANASLRVDEIAEIAVAQMSSAINVDKSSFSMLDAKTRQLTVIADIWDAEREKSYRDYGEVFALDDYPATEQVITTMLPAVFQLSDPTVDPAERAYMKEHGVATLVIIPLAIKSRTIGIIELETWQERIYSPDQLNLAMTLANQIAVAIDNARLFEAAEQELHERLQTELALQKSEKQFRSIFENAVMGLYRSTPDGQILMANPALVRMLGYQSFEELAATNLTTGGFSNDTPRSDFMNLITRDGLVIGLESTWIRKDGSLLHVQESGKAIYDNNGEIDFYEGTVEDISERKRIEQERQQLIEFQRIVAVLSARFINLSSDEIEDGIELALRRIAEYAQADGSSVWMFSADQSAASKSFGWPSNNKEASNQDVPIHKFSWIFDKLLKNNPVIVAGKKDVPPEIEDIHFLLDNGIMRAILAVPLVREGKVVGAFGIYMQEAEKNWADDLEALLKIIGDIIINALARQRAEENINKLNEELELRVIQRTQQLEAANKELEAFAYSVSHDLRAPLRAIDGFSLALLEDYGARLDEQAESYLHRVRAASQRMGQLIDDLLKLSRVTRSEMVHYQVDLSRLVYDIFAELQETSPERTVTLIIQPDLVVFGDKHLLQIMLTNLCQNAWKFTSKKEQAIIAFGGITEDKLTTYYVQDNGAGFDMTYVDKLFHTFQRLHTSSDFEGTGIGLATVKRIVARHGGRVWAQSEIDRGATFYFTIGEPLE